MKIGWKKFDWLLLFALAATVLAFVHPGDTVWLGDAGALMALAVNANATGVPAAHGLIGSVGVAYGALAVWLNQILLLATSNPIAIVAIRAGLCFLLSWGALWRLSRILNVRPGPGTALYFCSPFVWFYLRMPWDNILLLPLSLWYAVFLAWYLRDGKFRFAAGALVFLALMFDLHPVSGLVAPGFAVGVLWFRRAELRRDWKKFALAGLGVLLALSPRLISAVRDYVPHKCAPPCSLTESFWGAFTSFRNLTGWGFPDRFGPETGLSLSGTLLLLSVPVVVFFIVLGGVIAVKRFRQRQMTGFDRLCCCALASIGFYVLLLPLFRLAPQPHYHSAVLFAWLLIAWRGFAVFHSDHRKLAAGALGFALLLEVVFLAGFSVTVHRNFGTSSPYFRTTLARQWAVARNLAAAHRMNPDFRVDVRVEYLREHSLPLRVLISLAEKTELPEFYRFSGAVLTSSRSGYGIDQIFLK